MEPGLKMARMISETVILTDPTQIPTKVSRMIRAIRIAQTSSGLLFIHVVQLEKLWVEELGKSLNCISSSYALSLGCISVDYIDVSSL